MLSAVSAEAKRCSVRLSRPIALLVRQQHNVWCRSIRVYAVTDCYCYSYAFLILHGTCMNQAPGGCRRLCSNALCAGDFVATNLLKTGTHWVIKLLVFDTFDIQVYHLVKFWWTVRYFTVNSSSFVWPVQRWKRVGKWQFCTRWRQQAVLLLACKHSVWRFLHTSLWMERSE